MAEFFIELTINFRTDLDRSIASTVSERARMSRLLPELPSVRRVHDSGGNFALRDLHGEDPGIASPLRWELLADRKIEVKDVSDKYPDRLPRLRLAVRTEERQRPAAGRPLGHNHGSQAVSRQTAVDFVPGMREPQSDLHRLKAGRS